MNLVFTGKGSSGSWQIRGVQLARQLGAHCNSGRLDGSPADCIVLVKRVSSELLAQIRRMDVPWAWDVVDAYPQPAAYGWAKAEAARWFRAEIERLQPTGVIWPTRRMREDCDTGLPGLVLSHHHRPGIAPNPVRETIKVVAYEGSADYLGRWRARIERECAVRGWEFRVNPGTLADCDIVLAMRDGGGYVCEHWKSGVKLANAHGSGTPFIGQRECGYLENAAGSEVWCDGKDIGQALDSLVDVTIRRQIAEQFRKRAFTVEQAADMLKEFVIGLH